MTKLDCIKLKLNYNANRIFTTLIVLVDVNNLILSHVLDSIESPASKQVYPT